MSEQNKDTLLSLIRELSWYAQDTKAPQKLFDLLHRFYEVERQPPPEQLIDWFEDRYKRSPEERKLASDRTTRIAKEVGYKFRAFAPLMEIHYGMFLEAMERSREEGRNERQT